MKPKDCLADAVQLCQNESLNRVELEWLRNAATQALVRLDWRERAAEKMGPAPAANPFGRPGLPAKTWRKT